MSEQSELRNQIRLLRRALAQPDAPTTPAQAVKGAAVPPESTLDQPAPDVPAPDQPAPDVPAPDQPAPDQPAPAPDQPAPAPDQPADGGAGGGGNGGGGSGVGQAPTADELAAQLAQLEEVLNKQTMAARAATSAYLKSVGHQTLWWSAGLIALAFAVLTWKHGLLPKTDCKAPIRCAQYHQAVWAAAAAWLAVAFVSWLKQSDGGLVTMLIGRNGKFSTSYFQAWVWTLVICWGFAFFLADAIVRKAADVGAVANQLDADYFLLLGGPFAALVIAQQVKNSKVASGDVQQVQSTSTNLTDLVSSDDGRTDLVDTQYLFFNFVALATFAVMFARTPTDFPNLPDGLVLLTSGAALAYVGNKVVERNKPGITSVGLESGAGPLRVGDLVRVTGFNFVPAGAENEEFLARVRVRFGAAEGPVIPPGTPPAAGTDSAGTGVGSGARKTPALYADNVTSSALRIAIPPIPALPLDGQLVDVVVVTAGGAQTDPYPVFIQPRPLNLDLPATGRAGQPLTLRLPDVPDGEFVRVSIAGKAQDARVGPAHQVVVNVPAGLTGSNTVIVSGHGGSSTQEISLT